MEDPKLKQLDLKAPRTKRDYFSISREQGLPSRCPIFQRCERRCYTIELMHLATGLDRKFAPKPSEPIVPMIQGASSIGGSSAFGMQNLCPEVSLFEPAEVIVGFGGHPTTAGSYDRDMDPQVRITDTGHFSECAEYSALSSPLGVVKDDSCAPKPPHNQDSAEPNKVIMTLERIASAFPAVVKRLASRRGSRRPITVKDEYDVQYIFQALLAAEFADMRPEEPGPSTAGGGMRVDCLLKDEETFVEFKMTKRGDSDVRLRKELAEDFVIYAKHPNCKRLFIFIYDPLKLIANAAGFVSDLSQPRPPIRVVRTFVQQK